MPRTTEFHTNRPITCKCEEIGYVGKTKISAITDSAGSQVVARSTRIHLLSRPMENHKAAVLLAQRIVKARSTKIYKRWFNLKRSLGVGLFALFGGEFRNS